LINKLKKFITEKEDWLNDVLLNHSNELNNILDQQPIKFDNDTIEKYKNKLANK